MKRYTIGILFSSDFSQVLLIRKQKPDWQKGKLNFPGGKTEIDESPYDCISREFNEECDLFIPGNDWRFIGEIINAGNYSVDILTSTYTDPSSQGFVTSMTDEKVQWGNANKLPPDVISNLRWLVPFAKNIHQQGNVDALIKGTFEYEDIKF